MTEHGHVLLALGGETRVFETALVEFLRAGRRAVIDLLGRRSSSASADGGGALRPSGWRATARILPSTGILA